MKTVFVQIREKYNTGMLYSLKMDPFVYIKGK